MTTTSIRNRLVLTMVLTQALLAAGLVFTGVFYTHHRLRTSLDITLYSRAIRVAALVRYPKDPHQGFQFQSHLLPTSHLGAGDLFLIQSEGAGHVFVSPNWPADFELASSGNIKTYRTIKLEGVPYRILRLDHQSILDREDAISGLPSKLTIIYATSQLEMYQQVWRAGIYIALASLAFLGITVVLAMWGISRGLSPLQDLAIEAAHVSAHHWDFQPPRQSEMVSELKPLTSAMRTMLQRLHASFEQQREFLGNAAHELKTPVTILKSTLQSLLQRPRTSREYQVGLYQSLEEVERLGKLLNGMLRLARAEQWAYGTLDRRLEPVDIGSTCESAIESLRGLAHARHAEIQLQSQDGIICRADPEDLEQVWINLLENAIWYSPAGSTVKVDVGRTDHKARIVVEDQGAGIPADEISRIFERFHRGSSPRASETSGFGLGLAIAKALVEAYGGAIVPESRIAHGTRMTVDLPLTAD